MSFTFSQSLRITRKLEVTWSFCLSSRLRSPKLLWWLIVKGGWLKGVLEVWWIWIVWTFVLRVALLFRVKQGKEKLCAVDFHTAKYILQMTAFVIWGFVVIWVFACLQPSACAAAGSLWKNMCIIEHLCNISSSFFHILLLLHFPAISLWFTILGEIFAYVTVHIQHLSSSVHL